MQRAAVMIKGEMNRAVAWADADDRDVVGVVAFEQMIREKRIVSHLAALDFRRATQRWRPAS